MRHWMLILAGISAISLIAPPVGMILVAAILLLQLLVMGTRCLARLSRSAKPRRSGEGVTPVFSVHVATHNEPPSLVIATLDALAAQDWDRERWEVIVIDNNTADPALWRPVEAHCAALGHPFRFLHREGVKGAKAGALNISLDHARSDTTHVVTVDADYAVIPSFLSRAAEALAETGADYIQYPQAYLLPDRRAQGVQDELEEYFRSSAMSADVAEAVLLTGTLCVIPRVALERCGGWSGVTATEDAEMGVRLCLAGYSGRLIPQIVGKGLLPLSLGALEKQRFRWASGNLETLKGSFAPVIGGKGALRLGKRIAIVSQLTAWLNFSLLPGVILVTGLVTGQGTPWLAALCASSILLSFLDIAWRVVGRGLVEKVAGGTVLAALASRIALLPISAIATFSTLLHHSNRFVVTAKALDAPSNEGPLPLTHAMLALAAAVSLPAAFAAGPMVGLAVAMLILPLPAALLTGRTLRAYRAALVRKAST
jgi:cellulose synthase/poly-beta-1,6-N-acetylglucosamine synthase-like glycosyltransferase